MFGIYKNWLAILFVLLVHVVAYGILLDAIPYPLPDYEFVYLLVIPFADMGVLGFWLVVGSQRAWLRLLVTIVGYCTLLTIGLQAWDVHPMVLAPAYATTLSSVALGTLGLGCIAAYFPGWHGWQVRFALWEIIVATCLIALALAVLRTILVNDLLDWQTWFGLDGGEFLTFSLATGIFLTIAGLPILATGWKVRGIASLVMLILLSVLPVLEKQLFLLLGLADPDYELLYYTHFSQVALAWGTFIPLRWAFPTLIQAWNRPEQPSASCQEAPLTEVEHQPTDDFFKMQ
ncbi:hypothetical protein DTL42_07990 [Bremerella cremea]|uniref:Uncharacterized protein n=1 Tax=Bremerella cremea TaxID=1031537 RepID=A0A368KT01_9BACT|nr:hypothetical protein [Bremerella cremea]RCS52766.1 hypothetical protein DTL42_07990 [Bremerella cremea]